MPGTDRFALHMYLPLSDVMTGTKERERVVCLPRVWFPSSVTTVPLGPTHSNEGKSFRPGRIVTVHNKVVLLPLVAYRDNKLVVI